MINLQKNKEKAEKELEKFKFQDNIEDCEAAFHALIAEKKDDPKYRDTIKRYLIEKAKSDEELKTQQLTQDKMDFQTLMKDTGRIRKNLRRIEEEIIEIRLKEIMAEES